MAQAHAGLGCRVTVLESGRIASREDPAQAEALRTVLREDGVGLLEGVTVTGAEPGPALLLSDGRRIAGSHLLVAIGRTPNLEDLGLAEAGLRVTAQGIATDAGLRSLSHRHVFATGDIADPAGHSGPGSSPTRPATTPASSSAARCSTCPRGSTTGRSRG